jgi:hypothetical protein
MPNDRTTPVGTWRAEITAARDATSEDRGLRGQTAGGLLVLEPDHTCLCLTPGPGARTWQCDGSRSISFDFTEFINYHPDGSFTGYVQVTQKGTMSTNGDAFTSSGQGVVSAADGTEMTITRTTTQAARVSTGDLNSPALTLAGATSAPNTDQSWSRSAFSRRQIG